ncbi:hypothetical protein DLM46_24370 [Paraburkholderia lacunae]|uniref:Thiamine pyrophosphate enzyme N-terminal TPP-binding domain-containing protein n=1 Tax=Paraburkholderia lacunae TaxID=2211104 RepID=A0A370N3D7_9BURK|nr:hypothetical protein DLM46_24370 [Paraburkholderia lacunae]
MTTVHQACYEILREQGLTTFLGNPGSNELPFLKDLRSDFRCTLGLDEPPSSLDEQGKSNHE